MRACGAEAWWLIKAAVQEQEALQAVRDEVGRASSDVPLGRGSCRDQGWWQEPVGEATRANKLATGWGLAFSPWMACSFHPIWIKTC